jgi:hypothetical protein
MFGGYGNRPHVNDKHLKPLAPLGVALELGRKPSMDLRQPQAEEGWPGEQPSAAWPPAAPEPPPAPEAVPPAGIDPDNAVALWRALQAHLDGQSWALLDSRNDHAEVPASELLLVKGRKVTKIVWEAVD